MRNTDKLVQRYNRLLGFLPYCMIYLLRCKLSTDTTLISEILVEQALICLTLLVLLIEPIHKFRFDCILFLGFISLCGSSLWFPVRCEPFSENQVLNRHVNGGRIFLHHACKLDLQVAEQGLEISLERDRATTAFATISIASIFRVVIFRIFHSPLLDNFRHWELE